MTPQPPSRVEEPIVAAVLAWFDVNERPLPWRSSTPWGVLVSEFMLQQTPVQRVLPVWPQWLDRWPTPATLASASVADALRAWGRLGYPRRASRLHAAAVAIVRDHEGEVPAATEALRALPGVGEYTAAAVQAFAFRQRSVVMDTNVRRVLCRAVDGSAAHPAHITSAERTRADQLWPHDPQRSARWSGAVMELGALVCTASRPACGECPVVGLCAWTGLGQPEADVPRRRQADYAGSDRQARGRLLGFLRERSGSVPRSSIEEVWPEPDQAARALQSLIDDGLVVRLGNGRFGLPEA